MFSLLLALTLTAAPSTSLRVATPSLSYANLDEKTGDFFVDALGQELLKNGIKVVNQKEIGAVLSFERQKQLLGASDDKAGGMEELGSAFGVDAILTGSIAKTDSGYAANLKFVGAQNAETLAAESVRVKSNDALLDWLEPAAARMAKALKGSLGKEEPRALPQPETPKRLPPEENPPDEVKSKPSVAATHEVLWNGRWYPATILEKKKSGEAFIHYVGYGDSWNEWVSPARVREIGPPPPPPPPQSGKEVEVEWHGSWYPAHVLETKENGDAYIHYDGYADSWNEWAPPSRVRPRSK